MSSTTSNQAFEILKDTEFVVLTTYRRDGRPVPTTVWFALEGGKMYIQTLKGAGKIKRVGSTARVTIAPSDARGNVSGPELQGQGRVLEGAEINVAENALQSKYGLKRKGFLLMMRANDEAKRAYIEVIPS